MRVYARRGAAVSKREIITYRGHRITQVEELGWSDTQQAMVSNGFRLIVEGPQYNFNRQTYIGMDHDVLRAIDAAIAKATGGEE